MCFLASILYQFLQKSLCLCADEGLLLVYREKSKVPLKNLFCVCVGLINCLTPDAHKKVIHTYTNLQLKARGIKEYESV